MFCQSFSQTPGVSKKSPSVFFFPVIYIVSLSGSYSRPTKEERGLKKETGYPERAVLSVYIESVLCCTTL